MKNYKLKWQILLLGLLFSTNPIYSQSKFEMSAGLGMPELINARIKYGNNLQVGVCAGFLTLNWFGNNVVDWSCAAEITYHFLGKSKLVEQAPWYVLGGLGFYDLGIITPYEQYNAGFYPRIGRTLNFSKKSGMNLDVGIFLPLSGASGYNSPKFQVLASGNISFFIRL